MRKESGEIERERDRVNGKRERDKYGEKRDTGRDRDGEKMGNREEEGVEGGKE